MARPKNLTPDVSVFLDPRGTGFYLARWRDPSTGKRVLRGTSKTTEDDARAEVPSILAKFYNPAPADGWRVGDLLDAYVKVRIQEPHSKSFLHNFTHIRTYFGSFTVDQLNDAAFKRYRQHRTSHNVVNAGALASKGPAKPVLDSTAVRELGALAGAVIWGRSNGFKGLENVTVSRKNAPKNVRQRYLTRAEVEALLKACIEPHTALFVRLMLATGGRMSAVLELKWSETTFPASKGTPIPGDGMNDVVGSGRGAAHKFTLTAPIVFDLGRGRGNKRRGTGIVSTSNFGLYAELLGAWSAREQRIFDGLPVCDNVVSFRGKPLGKVDLSDAYRRAGIVGATQHTLKHTCVSHLVQAGVSYERIAKLIGTSAKMIEATYGHLDPKHLEAAGDVLSYA